MTWLRYSEIEDRPDWLHDGARVWVFVDFSEKPELCVFDSDAEEFVVENDGCTWCAIHLCDGTLNEIYVHQAAIPAKPEGVLP